MCAVTLHMLASNSKLNSSENIIFLHCFLTTGWLKLTRENFTLSNTFADNFTKLLKTSEIHKVHSQHGDTGRNMKVYTSAFNTVYTSQKHTKPSRTINTLVILDTQLS